MVGQVAGHAPSRASGSRRDVVAAEPTVPDVGSRSPIIMRMVVVLPAPFRPRKPNTQPASTVEGELVDRDERRRSACVRCSKLDHESVPPRVANASRPIDLGERHVALGPAFEQLHVRRVDGHLREHGVGADPAAEPELVPRVVVEAVVPRRRAGDDARRDAGRASERGRAAPRARCSRRVRARSTSRALGTVSARLLLEFACTQSSSGARRARPGPARRRRCRARGDDRRIVGLDER